MSDKGIVYSISIFYSDGTRSTFNDVHSYTRDKNILEIKLLFNNPETIILNLDKIDAVYLKVN